MIVATLLPLCACAVPDFSPRCAMPRLVVAALCLAAAFASDAPGSIRLKDDANDGVWATIAVNTTGTVLIEASNCVDRHNFCGRYRRRTALPRLRPSLRRSAGSPSTTRQNLCPPNLAAYAWSERRADTRAMSERTAVSIRPAASRPIASSLLPFRSERQCRRSCLQVQLGVFSRPRWPQAWRRHSRRNVPSGALRHAHTPWVL